MIPPAQQDLGWEQARLSPLVTPTHAEVTLDTETFLLSVYNAVTGACPADSTGVQPCYRMREMQEPPRGWRTGKVSLPLLLGGKGGLVSGQGGGLFPPFGPEMLK